LPGADPNRARRRLQGGLTLIRLTRPASLRGRLFVGIAATVTVSVLVTLATGAYLTRRSVESEGIRSLARQIDLIAAQRSAKGVADRPGPNLGDFLATEQERLAILTQQQADLLLPDSAVTAIRARKVASGTLDLHGTRYLYAARRNGQEALVLLRSARKQSADWTPFLKGLGVAAAVGAALAAIVAFLLARAVARPITRVAAASRRLAAGEAPEPLPEQGAGEVAALSASFNHLAAELARAQDAERAFLLSVSHELKTPLTVIRGHAEALQDGVVGDRHAGAVIERESGRLERLIRDLLDLARLRRRSFTAAQSTVDLGEIAREVVARFQPQARSFDVELTVTAEAGAEAGGDADRVVQALSNLVENAIRCTPGGEAVRVLASAGRLDVVDDGPGLSAEDLERAFERFYLYERYGAERPVGTGLGLAIVRELAEAMGGTVAVRSTPGVGSTFSLLLPSPAAAGEQARSAETREFTTP
jgi:two-component system, OmpR family, sensor kinase